MAKTYPELPAPRWRTKYSAQDDYELMRMYRMNATYITIARALGRNGRSVEERVKRLIYLGRIKARIERPRKDGAGVSITKADLEWMDYWRQPRAVRRQVSLTGEAHA